MTGFSSIGLMRPKYESNIGGVLRAAHCYSASMVAIQGQRAKIRQCTDTTKTWRHIPVLRGDDLSKLIPFDAVPIAVDLVEGAESLVDFEHPKRAFYIFGPEDGTLGKSTFDWCSRKVFVPTQHCMNLAATVNVVLYDRMVKMGETP